MLPTQTLLTSGLGGSTKDQRRGVWFEYDEGALPEASRRPLRKATPWASIVSLAAEDRVNQGVQFVLEPDAEPETLMERRPFRDAIAKDKLVRRPMRKGTPWACSPREADDVEDRCVKFSTCSEVDGEVFEVIPDMELFRHPMRKGTPWASSPSEADDFGNRRVQFSSCAEVDGEDSEVAADPKLVRRPMRRGTPWASSPSLLDDAAARHVQFITEADIDAEISEMIMESDLIRRPIRKGTPWASSLNKTDVCDRCIQFATEVEVDGEASDVVGAPELVRRAMRKGTPWASSTTETDDIDARHVRFVAEADVDGEDSEVAVDINIVRRPVRKCTPWAFEPSVTEADDLVKKQVRFTSESVASVQVDAIRCPVRKGTPYPSPVLLTAGGNGLAVRFTEDESHELLAGVDVVRKPMRKGTPWACKTCATEAGNIVTPAVRFATECDENAEIISANTLPSWTRSHHSVRRPVRKATPWPSDLQAMLSDLVHQSVRFAPTVDAEPAVVRRPMRKGTPWPTTAPVDAAARCVCFTPEAVVDNEVGEETKAVRQAARKGTRWAAKDTAAEAGSVASRSVRYVIEVNADGVAAPDARIVRRPARKLCLGDSAATCRAASGQAAKRRVRFASESDLEQEIGIGEGTSDHKENVSTSATMMGPRWSDSVDAAELDSRILIERHAIHQPNGSHSTMNSNAAAKGKCKSSKEPKDHVGAAHPEKNLCDDSPCSVPAGESFRLTKLFACPPLPVTSRGRGFHELTGDGCVWDDCEAAATRWGANEQGLREEIAEMSRIEMNLQNAGSADTLRIPADLKGTLYGASGARRRIRGPLAFDGMDTVTPRQPQPTSFLQSLRFCCAPTTVNFGDLQMSFTGSHQ